MNSLSTKHSRNASSSWQLEVYCKGDIIDLSPLKCWQAWTGWQGGGCQPNFWHNVSPDSTSYCGPYRVSALSRKGSDSDSARDGLNKELHEASSARTIGYGNHDTISMAVIDKVRVFNHLKLYMHKEFVNPCNQSNVARIFSASVDSSLTWADLISK